MIQVRAPDGTLVQFPDGTTPDVMKDAMRRKYGGPAAAPPAGDKGALPADQPYPEPNIGHKGDMLPGDLCSLHPVVGRQKGTGRPYLFVNQAMAALVVGLSEPESDKLLDELFSYLYADGMIYEHVWHNGDIVIWDNLAVQHSRKALSNETRTLQRVTIAKTSYVAQHVSQNRVYEYLRTFEKPAA